MSLSTTGLRKSYGANNALRGVSFSVSAGQVHGLVGANGAGKSTLVKSLSGAIRPDSGTITVDSWTGSTLNPRLAQHLGIASIYQDPGLAPTLGLVENILLGHERSRLGFVLATSAQRAEVAACLDEVGLQRPLNTPAGALSPADQQLLQIAKALFRRASTVIMDEPSASLGEAERQQLFKVVRGLRSTGVAVIYVSHHLHEVLELCDEVTVMRSGQIVLQEEASKLTVHELVTSMIGHEIISQTPKERPLGQVALQVHDVSQKSGLHSISFQVRQGEVLGITGLVGSGRSRLARVLFGIEPFHSGRMEVFGKPYQPRTPAQAIKRGIGLVPEDRKRDALLMYLSAAKNVTLPKLPTRLFGWLNLRREHSIAQEWIRKLEVSPPSARAFPINLSGGNQQKLIIARWINAGSRVLILDEPGQGVDVGARDQILQAVRNIAQSGTAVIIISQEVEELQQIADRVLVMRKGRIVGELSRDQVSESTVIPLAMGAEPAIHSSKEFA
jgi:ABC-type sugar transport system ATPase subunit